MKDLSYYNKLGFENVFSWEEEDIANFLVWDHVEDCKHIDYLEDFISGMLERTKTLMKEYNKRRFYLNLFDKVFKKSYFKGNKKKKILFNSMKYQELILQSKKKYCSGLIVMGKRDRLFSVNNFMDYISLTDLNQYVHLYFKERKISYFHDLIRAIEKKLRDSNPDYVILWHDTFPIERAIVLACKRLGILVLEVQHGLYQSQSFLTSGKMVDYLLVWGEYFKDLCIKQNIKESDNIYILGYPHKRINLRNRIKKKHLVCYLGQDYESFGDSFLLDIKVKTLTDLNNICRKLDLDFIYRPHPRDKIDPIKRELKTEIKFVSPKESLLKTIAKGDIFISFNSTSLVEAAINSKIALQLINYPFVTDNYGKLGICQGSFKNTEELSEYLQEIIENSKIKKSYLENNNFKFSNYYTETRYNLGESFKKILTDIGRREKKHES